MKPPKGDVFCFSLLLTFGELATFSSLAFTLASSDKFSLVDDAEMPFSNCSNSFSNLEWEEGAFLKILQAHGQDSPGRL